MARPETYDTRQGRNILTFLKRHRGEHFDLNSLCKAMEQEGIGMGKTTAWRYLERLCAEGTVRKTAPDGKRACYSYGCCQKEHYHLHCNNCGKLIHLDCPHFDTLKEHFLSVHGFAIDSFQTTIHGRCRECREKGEAL